MRPIQGLRRDEIAELRERLARLSEQAAQLALRLEAALAAGEPAR